MVSTIPAPDGTSDVIVSVLGLKLGGPPPTSQFYTSLLTSAGALNLASFTSSSLASTDVAAGDFNGDGIVDFFVTGSPTSYAYLGDTSGGFSRDAGIGGLDPNLTSLMTGDFDGDGCTDLFTYTSGTPLLTYAYNCNPAVPTSTPPPPTTLPPTLGDFNGDGKTDILLTSSTGAPTLWISTGTGFVNPANSLPSGSTIVAVGDWNGDGKADILVNPGGGGDYALYLSTSTDFTPARDSSGNPIVLAGSAGASASVADWNNDGASDILVQAGGLYDEYNLIAYTPELMTSVSNGIGATTNITYDRINQKAPFYTKCTNGTFVCGTSYPTQSMDGPQNVVKEVDASNGLGTCTPPSTTNCYITQYSYTGAQKDLQGRGFLGFLQVVANDLQTNIVQTTNYSTSFPYIGLVTLQTKVHSGVTLSSTANTYTNNSSCGVTPAGSGVYVDCLAQTVVVRNDLNGAAFPTTTTNYTYDDYGNALTVNVSVSDGSSKNTTSTYSNDTTNWFLGRLLTTSVNSVVGSSNLTRQSSFAYDAATGLLTQETIEPGVSTCNSGGASCTLTTAYTYDAFGHRITTTVYGIGIATRTSYTFYDALGQFQTSDANALGQYEFWAYDARFGEPTSHTGPNFLTTSWTYDSFGRMTQETRPNGTQTRQSYTYCSGGCPTYGQFDVQSEILAPSGAQAGPVTTAYYDMLSRGIANDSQGFDGSNIRVATDYNAKGQVQETSRPYFAASATPAWTQYTYDDLGRVTQVTFPDASHTSYGFNGLTTSVTNNLGQATTTVKNAQGLNYQVTDATSHTTTYIYDAFGDLLTVTDPQGNTITNSFDLRGNKYASSDPDMGSWTYVYDVLSELTSQTDAKSQTTTLSYDLLGRALTRTEPSLYSAWSYGTSAASHNIGQLIEAKACTASGCATLASDKTYIYDGLSRQVSYILQTPTDYYGYGTTYDGATGQIASVTYPSGYVVNRSYNGQGFLAGMTGPTGDRIWTVNARDAELHLTSQTAGNGIATTQSFDPLTGLIQNQRAGPGSAVASFDYGFDSIGNLSTRTDNTQPFTERFCYDSLNRLTQYNVGSACTGGKTASYDAVGNITTKSDTGSYSYGGASPHAVSSIAGTVDGLANPQYSYDGNGNLTCVSSGGSCSGTVGRQVSLTSFNMAASLTQGGTMLSLAYDDQHQRLQQTSTTSGVTTTTA